MGKEILVDLSHPFGQGNPIWPSGGDFWVRRINLMPQHYRLLQTFNDFHMHNSTHADSPAHVIPNSAYTHELPLENYYGDAVIVSIPKDKWELVTPEEFEAAEPKIKTGDIVILNTGTHKHWGENDEYFM
jgi:kynurenine formamidase